MRQWIIQSEIDITGHNPSRSRTKSHCDTHRQKLCFPQQQDKLDLKGKNTKSTL